MLGHKRVLLKAFWVATNVQALCAITIALASPKVVTEANWFPITVGWNAASQGSWHGTLSDLLCIRVGTCFALRRLLWLHLRVRLSVPLWLLCWLLAAHWCPLRHWHQEPTYFGRSYDFNGPSSGRPPCASLARPPRVFSVILTCTSLSAAATCSRDTF